MLQLKETIRNSKRWKFTIFLRGLDTIFTFFGLSLIHFSEQKEFFGNDGMLLGFVCHFFKVNSNVEIRLNVDMLNIDMCLRAP